MLGLFLRMLGAGFALWALGAVGKAALGRADREAIDRRLAAHVTHGGFQSAGRE